MTEKAKSPAAQVPAEYSKLDPDVLLDPSGTDETTGEHPKESSPFDLVGRHGDDGVKSLVDEAKSGEDAAGPKYGNGMISGEVKKHPGGGSHETYTPTHGEGSITTTKNPDGHGDNERFLFQYDLGGASYEVWQDKRTGQMTVDVFPEDGDMTRVPLPGKPGNVTGDSDGSPESPPADNDGDGVIDGADDDQDPPDDNDGDGVVDGEDDTEDPPDDNDGGDVDGDGDGSDSEGSDDGAEDPPADNDGGDVDDGDGGDSEGSDDPEAPPPDGDGGDVDAPPPGGGVGTSTDPDDLPPSIPLIGFDQTLPNRPATGGGDVDPPPDGNVNLGGGGAPVDVKGRYLGGDSLEPRIGGGRDTGTPLPGKGNTDPEREQSAPDGAQQRAMSQPMQMQSVGSGATAVAPVVDVPYELPELDVFEPERPTPDKPLPFGESSDADTTDVDANDGSSAESKTFTELGDPSSVIVDFEEPGPELEDDGDVHHHAILPDDGLPYEAENGRNEGGKSDHEYESTPVPDDAHEQVPSPLTGVEAPDYREELVDSLTSDSGLNSDDPFDA